jgi:uncharacterized protein CbrC (UPF0167 family)
MAEYHLHRWSVCSTGDPFQAPELHPKRLAGLRCEDDREIVTSSIVSIDGRRVTTYSGSVYILEEIDPEFLSWMQENNMEYDPENPIKVREL